MSFSELGLHPFIQKAIESSGYTEPTPVQAQAVPAALTGVDLLVSSQTGSGKTAAFLLPSLNRLAEPAKVAGNGPRILVLTPTRELAQQVEKAARTYGREIRRLRTASLVGGSPYGLQLKQLSQPVDVVVATPGRLMDHMDRGRIDFARLEVLVLDEADRMLDMGFIDDIEAIVAQTPESRQTLLFSATLDGVVGKLAKKLTRDPQRIEIAALKAEKANIEQRLHFVDDHEHKSRLLDHLLRDVALNQAVVFTATKRSAEDLTLVLRDNGFHADALHGDMPQHKRNRTIDRLRDGRTRVLVATDVAARGIDVAGVTHVINFDAPRQAEDYVHRIGRTGRAGRTGIAVTLVGHRERHLVREIERYTGNSLNAEVIPGLEPKARPPRPEDPRQGKPRFGNNDWSNKPRRAQERPQGGYGYRNEGESRGYGNRNPEGNFRREDDRGGKAVGEWQARPKSNWSDAPRSGERRGNTDAQPASLAKKGDPARREDSWKSAGNDWNSRGGWGKPKPGAKPGAKRNPRSY